MSNKSAVEISKGFAPDTIRSRGNYRREGHGFSTGDVVYFDGTVSDWRKSDWMYYNLTGSSDALGIIDVHDDYRFDVVYRGSILLPDDMEVTGPTGPVQENTVYFLSDTPGVLTATPPIVDRDDPMVRKPMIVTLNSTDDGFINSLVVNYRGYVEDTYGCVAFIQNLIPVGTIEYLPGGPKQWAGEESDSWLLCDGNSYLKEDYPELYSVIGSAYNVTGGIQEGYFRVPDLWHKDPLAGPDQRILRHSLLGPPVVRRCACGEIGVCHEEMCAYCFGGSTEEGVPCVSSRFQCCTGRLQVCGTVEDVEQALNSVQNPCDIAVISSADIMGGEECECVGSSAQYHCNWPDMSGPGVTGGGPFTQCSLGNAHSVGQAIDPCVQGMADNGANHPALRGSCDGCNSPPVQSTIEDYCQCCKCESEAAWGCATSPQVTSGTGSPPVTATDNGGTGGPTPTATDNGGTGGPTPTASGGGGTDGVTPTSTPGGSGGSSPTATPHATPSPTPTPFPTPGLPPELQGRIMIGKNLGATTSTAYSGSDDIEIVPNIDNVIDGGSGYNEVSENKNRQAVYHCNFYIRARSVTRYVNIETCNGAGGAVRNWIQNGSFNVWQRGISFDPDASITGSDHLADLNRYTADRWFRKVGFCPEGLGSTGTGESAPSAYVGVCNRKSFNLIDTTIPDALQNQHPTHFMEYQSFVSGPGADTSLEYCALENRISDVKTLSGENVCLSFWARSNTPGSVYVNLKQHFGYDIPNTTSLLARSTSSDTNLKIAHPSTALTSTNISLGIDYTQFVQANNSTTTALYINDGFPKWPAAGAAFYTNAPSNALSYTDELKADYSSVGKASDEAIKVPNTEQVKAILASSVGASLGLDNSPLMGDKYGIEVPSKSGQPVTFFKNTKGGPLNIKVEGRGSKAKDIGILDGESIAINKEANVSLPITVGIECARFALGAPTNYSRVNGMCTNCFPTLTSLESLGANLLLDIPIFRFSCPATKTGVGPLAVSAGETGATITTSISIPLHLYTLVQKYTKGETADLPRQFKDMAVNFANTLVANNPSACRCGIETTRTVTMSGEGGCLPITIPKNFDPTDTQGICCQATIGFAAQGDAFVTYNRTEDQTVHGCAEQGGQFIPYSAVDYFAEFDPTQCGVTEDKCSRFARIDVTQEWQQFHVVFQVPSVDNRYIGNSGTDYLAVQLWTHLSNGYCRAYSEAEAPPRNRLGTDYGSVECSENALCEPCVAAYPLSFSYEGTLNLAQFQLESGTEFTGFVKPNIIEDLDYCQSFFEKNSCVGRGEYFPVNGNAFLEYQVELKKQKICTKPRPIIYNFNAGSISTTGLYPIDILADSITQRGFSVGADVVADNSGGIVAFGYECDCDIYRPEELQYLNKQLAWKSAGN